MRSTILDALRVSDTDMTVAELATRCHMPATTVRFHLRALVDDGLVGVEPSEQAGRGRPRLLYRARPAMDPSGPRTYDVLAEILVQSLATAPDAETRATAAGQAWGRARATVAVDPIDDLIAVLDDFGFAPEPTRDEGVPSGIRLDRCPFLELARRHPGVTCSVHRGIMQGVLASHRTELRLARLDAFVDGDHCFASLTTGDHP